MQVDPVEDRERMLAQGLQRIHRDMLGYHDSVVHAHIDGDALVYVIEGPALPHLPADQQKAIHTAVAELVHRILGQELHSPIQDIRCTPELNISVLLLRPSP